MEGAAVEVVGLVVVVVVCEAGGEGDPVWEAEGLGDGSSTFTVEILPGTEERMRCQLAACGLLAHVALRTH